MGYGEFLPPMPQSTSEVPAMPYMAVLFRSKHSRTYPSLAFPCLPCRARALRAYPLLSTPCLPN